jgi:hypothetical protein
MSVKKAWIFTIIGAIGVWGTSLLSIICHDKAKTKTEKKDKVISYIPAVAAGVVTTGCILAGQRITAKELAGATALAGYLAKRSGKLESLVKENNPQVLNEFKQQEAQNLTDAQKGVLKEEVGKLRTIEMSKHKGTLRCLEGYSGRIFYSTQEAVEEAERKLNDAFKRGIYISYNDFYDFLGIEQTHFGAQFGWAPSEDYYEWRCEEPIEFANTVVEMDDGEPLLLIDIYTYPMEYYMEV